MKEITSNELHNTEARELFSENILLQVMTKEIIKEFIERLHSKNTKSGYLKELKKFFQYRINNNLSLKESLMTRGDAISYTEHLIHNQQLAPKTIHRNISALCSYFEYLLEVGIVNSNIFKGISKKIEDKPLVPTKVLSSEQVKEILNLSEKDILHHTVLTILFYTGIRVGELVSLTRESYCEEEEGGEKFNILIYRAKGDKIIKKVLNKAVVKVLNKYLQHMISIDREIKTGEPLLQPMRNFFTECGNQILNRSISTCMVNKIVKKYLRLIGIDKTRGYSAHSARTTLITRLIETGNDIYQVSKEIGHADVATTQRCYDRSKRKLKESLLLNKDIYQ